MSRTKIRYGVIGAGPRGRALIHAALASGEVAVAGIADVDPAAIEQALKLVPDARPFADYRHLIEWGEFDALVIAVPNHLHEQVAMACLDTPYPILCEKPLSTTMASIDRILAKAASRKPLFQIGLELRHHPMFREMKRQIESGEIGPVQMMWCKEFRPPFKPGFGSWRHKALSGGSLLEKNCHHFDVMGWIIDSEPVKVSAFGGKNVVYQHEEVLDNAWVMVEYKNGARASLGLALFQKEFYLEIGALGHEGSAVSYSPDEKLTVSGKGGSREIVYGHLSERGFDHGGEVEQHLAFVDAIRTGSSAADTFASIRSAHLVCLAAEESIRTGQTVDLQTWKAPA